MARYSTTTENLSLPPLQLCFFFLALLLFLCFSWYINYESTFDDFLLRLKLLLIVCPVILLLAVHWLSAEERRRVPFTISLPDSQDYIHRAGGSPWGVAALLVFLFVMVSYRASIQEKWFPLLSKLI